MDGSEALPEDGEGARGAEGFGAGSPLAKGPGAIPLLLLLARGCCLRIVKVVKSAFEEGGCQQPVRRQSRLVYLKER